MDTPEEPLEGPWRAVGGPLEGPWRALEGPWRAPEGFIKADVLLTYLGYIDRFSEPV